MSVSADAIEKAFQALCQWRGNQDVEFREQIERLVDMNISLPPPKDHSTISKTTL